MTNYVINKQKLKEILLMHKTFISKRCQELISKGIDVTKLTYRESDKFTDEFIDTMITKLPIDSMLDQVDEVMKQTVGYTSKELMDRKEHEEKDFIEIPFSWYPTKFYKVTFEGWENYTLTLDDPTLSIAITLAAQTLDAFIRIHKDEYAFGSPELGIKPNGVVYFKIGTLEKEEYKQRSVTAPSSTVTDFKEASTKEGEKVGWNSPADGKKGFWDNLKAYRK